MKCKTHPLVRPLAVTRWHAGSPAGSPGPCWHPPPATPPPRVAKKPRFPWLQPLPRNKKGNLLYFQLCWHGRRPLTPLTRKQSEGAWRKRTAASGCGAGRLGNAAKARGRGSDTLPSLQLPQAPGGDLQRSPTGNPPWKCEVHPVSAAPLLPYSCVPAPGALSAQRAHRAFCTYF